MPRHHIGLIVVWLAILATFGLGVLFESPLCVVLPFFAAWVAAIVTYRCIRYEGVLRFPTVYRVLVGTLLLSATVTTIAAGGTMVFAHELPIDVVGCAVLGTVNLVLSLATWKVLVRPHARKAALVGMFACVTEIFAMIIDVLVNASIGGINRADDHMLFLAFIGGTVTIGTGALACIAALATFEPGTPTVVPKARVRV